MSEVMSEVMGEVVNEVISEVIREVIKRGDQKRAIGGMHLRAKIREGRLH